MQTASFQTSAVRSAGVAVRPARKQVVVQASARKEQVRTPQTFAAKLVDTYIAIDRGNAVWFPTKDLAFEND
jgi:hypothetical protein